MEPAMESTMEPATEPARPAAPAEKKTDNELDRIRSKVALWDADERQAQARPGPLAGARPLHQSDVIHVMGSNRAGRYIAHTLAGCGTIPPVRYILAKHYQYREWHQRGRRLTLYRGHDRIDRLGVVAEYVSEYGSQQEAASGNGRVIDNLIVTLPASQVVKALGLIRHRLNHNSTICLVNDGLGVAEALIEAYFPDVLTRPIFLLGHFTTALDRTGDAFSVIQVRPGRLYLSLFSPQGQDGNRHFRVKSHPPWERVSRATHLLRLLTAVPGLHASGHPMPDFLRYKLPKVAFRAVVEPLAALFDCRYDYLPTNRPASLLMDKLIGELSSVVSRLPECRDSEKLRQFALAESLRRDTFRKLMLQRTADSPMRAHVGRGWETDLEFLSGYFARRGREVQARVTTLEAVMWSVRAKQNVLLKKLANEIPYDASEAVELAHEIPYEAPEAVEEGSAEEAVSTAVNEDDTASVHHSVNTLEA